MKKQQRHEAPKVTVLMCVYNSQTYLRQAIESILGQTYSGFEFLILNDGSTDHSPEIIDSYDDIRIRVINNSTNIGLTKSLNRGLAAAKGSFIARHDADDISHPTRLQKQVEFMELHPSVVLLGTQVRTIDKKGRPVCDHLWTKATAQCAVLLQLIFDNPFVHSSVMFRRDVVWDQLHGYNEDFLIGQDFELWSRIAAEHNIQNLEECLVDFRRHPSAVSADYSDIYSEDFKVIFRTNLKRIIHCNEGLEQWPDLRVGINNPKLLKKEHQTETAIDTIEIIFDRFCQLNPETRLHPQAQQVLANTYMRLAFGLIRYNRRVSAKACIKAFRADGHIAWPVRVKYLLRFLLGESIVRFIRHMLSSVYHLFSDNKKRAFRENLT